MDETQSSIAVLMVFCMAMAVMLQIVIRQRNTARKETESQSVEIARLMADIESYKKSATEYFTESQALKAERDAAKKAEESAVNSNRTLQETIAANGLLIEERDDEIEKLKEAAQKREHELDLSHKANWLLRNALTDIQQKINATL